MWTMTTSDDHLREIDDLISRSSLGGEGSGELAARTPDATIDAVLGRKATEEQLARLDEALDEHRAKGNYMINYGTASDWVVGQEDEPATWRR